jgi:hypothetical protein
MSYRAKLLDTTDSITTVNSSAIDCRRIDTLSFQCIADVTTPAAKTFVDGDVTTATDLIAIAAHGFTTGLKVAATTDGVLPAGLSATDYYVIVVSSGTIKLASSLANALAGTAVDITAAAGGGTHTLTPATASGSWQLQVSNDNSTFENQGSATSFTADDNSVLRLADVGERYARVSAIITAGRADFDIIVSGKERAVR